MTAGTVHSTASKLAVAAACLFGAAGLMWAVLPASEAGGYYNYGGQADGADGLETAAAEAVPVQGRMTVYMVGEGTGGAAGDDMDRVEELTRSIARNWVNGTITDAEYFAAMSYLYELGYLEDAAAGRSNEAQDEAAVGKVDGPAGSSQGWCKDGLALRTNAFTGDMVCVPDGYADGDVGARWIEPYDGAGTAAVAGGDSDMSGGYGAGPSAASDAAWQWRAPQDGSTHFGGEQAGTYESDLRGQIADLEEINEGLLRTVARLQEALMEVHMEGRGGSTVSADGGSTGLNVAGQVESSSGVSTVNTAQAAATAVLSNGDVCLHGTDATFTSVIDPVMLLETDGSLGTIPMPDGRYTVLLMAASSTPVSVGIQLAGDAGLSYDRTFTLADTERPPGEDATMWDYNSGVAELVVGEAQVVNATAAVTGGDGMAVFAALARCR